MFWISIHIQYVHFRFFRFKRFWFCSYNVPVNFKRLDLQRLAICWEMFKMNPANSLMNALEWNACLNPVQCCTVPRVIWNGSLALLCRRIFNLRSFDLRPEPWPWVAPLSVSFSSTYRKTDHWLILVRRKLETLVTGTERRAQVSGLVPPVQYLNNGQNLRSTPGQAEPTTQYSLKISNTAGHVGTLTQKGTHQGKIVVKPLSLLFLAIHSINILEMIRIHTVNWIVHQKIKERIYSVTPYYWLYENWHSNTTEIILRIFWEIIAPHGYLWDSLQHKGVSDSIQISFKT